jgi:hypothetical protein
VAQAGDELVVSLVSNLLNEGADVYLDPCHVPRIPAARSFA